MRVRTRFAPSPTGRMHVGNLRTALYAYLIAKHENGDFLLRIEDTDQERFYEGAIDIINATIEQAGLIPDEGPGIGGDVGPYVQSERQKQGIYLSYAHKLIEKGEAYYCFCDAKRLEECKQTIGDKTISIYDKHCLSLTQEEIQERLDQKQPFVIRQNNPREGVTAFMDEIYGKIEVDNAELDDMVLIKSDGFPTYNFANVVDDHLMGITHVVRGNEYLSSAPKYNRLYEAFGWDVPVYVHCPLITNEAHEKLSKRSGHSSFEDLLDAGFLPETIVNFVALLGWSPADNQEIMSMQEMIEKFDYKAMSKSPAVFDVAKLKWMNSEYFKAMDEGRFYEIASQELQKLLPSTLDFVKIASLVKTRIDVLTDLKEQVDFFSKLPDYDISLYTHKKMKTNPENSCELLKAVLPILEEQDDFSNDGLFSLLKAYSEANELKVGYVMWPLRTAVSGKAATPGGATELMSILGKEETITRIKSGINKLENEA